MEFIDVMSKRTDEELIKIVTLDREGYQFKAVEAAEKEINNRNIDITLIEQIKKDITTKNEEIKEIEFNKVSSLKRFINYLLDTIASIIISTVLITISGFFINSNNETSLSILNYLLFAIGFFGYYVFMETKYQKTIGKYITNTKVINKDGTKPKYEVIIGRTFCRLIPFDNFTFLFTSNGFHDRLSETTVIKD